MLPQLTMQYFLFETGSIPSTANPFSGNPKRFSDEVAPGYPSRSHRRIYVLFYHQYV